MAPLTLPMKGSCVCETIQFTLNAQPIFTNCCHCRNCQKISGSAFAVNIMVESTNISVTSTTQPTMKYGQRLDQEINEWKSFHCGKCWFMLWGTHKNFGDGIVFLRAGTLERSDEVMPDAHFFVRSKHPWVPVPEGVRAFETFPGKDEAPLWTGEVMARVDAAKGSNDQA